MSWADYVDIAGFWNRIRFEDFIDIAIVAVALSILLTWLKRRANRPLLLAGLILLGVYGLARWRNLYLTLLLFRVGAVVFVAATLLAYQDDFRRGFERLVSGRFFRRRRAAENESDLIVTLTDAAFALASRRFGALIVLRGDEHLERHLHGGQIVGGTPSVPLLLSIFDPHAPTHDGAVVIGNRGKIDRVSVHLPLSSKLRKVAGHGTRHAAALGLSESSDAIVLIVSEERGTVGIAAAGEIIPIDSPSELSGRLTEFYGDQASDQTPLFNRRWIRIRDLDAKIAAVGLAIILWFAWAAPSDPVQQNYEVPVELVGLPGAWKIRAGPIPPDVSVTITGPEPAFRRLDEASLRLKVDLSRARLGSNQLETDNAKLELPEALRVERMDSETVYVELVAPDGTPRP